MSHSRQFTDDAIIKALEAGGGSWRDYILLGEPPLVCRWSKAHGLAAVADDDNERASATREFLQRRGARHFATFEDVCREFGWDGKARIST